MGELWKLTRAHLYWQLHWYCTLLPNSVIIDSFSLNMAESEIHKKPTPSPSGCHGNKPHKCYICGRRFKSQNGLEDHVRTHYDEEYSSGLYQEADSSDYVSDCASNLNPGPEIELDVNDAKSFTGHMHKPCLLYTSDAADE